MEPVYFVLAIMGCGDGQAQCVPARTEPVHYTSAAQCQAALPAVLARHTDLDFPVISGACRRTGMEIASAGTSPRG